LPEFNETLWLRGVDEVIRRFCHRLRKDERGAEMLEFAIVALVFFPLVLGLIEFGWIFHGYITLTGAAREGVRLAAVMEVDDENEIKDVIKEHARIFQLDNNDIVINPASFDEERIITVSGDLDLIVFPGSININSSATMRQEN